MFKHFDKNGVVEVVCETDRLDILLGADLRAKLEECLTSYEGDLIFNLEGVAYIDSSIIGVLIHYRRKLDTMNRNLILTSLSNGVQKIFELTKLISFFDVR